MADLATAGIAALASGASTLFTYNRDAFIFERQMYQAMVYHEQAMRVQEAALYREDLRDLFDLTIKKMDSYLVINTLMLGFAVSLFCTATVPQGTPDWLFWLYSLSLVGSCVFLLLSVWLALQASLTAQSYSVRLLTQWMRLPVPTRRDIEKAASKLRDYERAGAGKLLRLPAIVGEGWGTSEEESEDEGGSEESEEEDDETMRMRIKRRSSLIMGGRELHKSTLTHFRLFSTIQQHWAGLDSYSRVFMTIGANQLLQCIGHFSLSYFMILGEQLWAPLSFLLCVTFTEYLHVRLNIMMETKDVVTTVALLSLVPFLSYFATLSFIKTGEESFQTRSIVVLCFFAHLAWLLYTLYQGYEHKRGLPKRFIMVGLVNDILGDGPMKRTLERALGAIGRAGKEIPVGAAATIRVLPANHSPLDLPFLGGPDASNSDAENFADLDAKARKLERRIQKLFEAWKAVSAPVGGQQQRQQQRQQQQQFGGAGLPGDLDRAILLRARFRKLQKALKSAGRLSVPGTSAGDGLLSPVGSVLSSSPRSSRFATGTAGWLHMRVDPTKGDSAGQGSGVYYLNPATGEIRLNAPDLGEGLAVPASEQTRIPARERELRTEMAAFAKFVQEAREIRDRRRQALHHQPKANPEAPVARLMSSSEEGHFVGAAGKGGRKGGRGRLSSEDSTGEGRLRPVVVFNDERHHSTGVTMQGWWIFRQASVLLLTAWTVSTVWAVCRWFDVETGDQHVVEGERTPIRDRRDAISDFATGHFGAPPRAPAAGGGGGAARRLAAVAFSSAPGTGVGSGSCVVVEKFPWAPAFYPTRMRPSTQHSATGLLVFTDGRKAVGVAQPAGDFVPNSDPVELSLAGRVDAGVCPDGPDRVFKFVVGAQGGGGLDCYGVLEGGADVVFGDAVFTYPDRNVEIVDVAWAPEPAAAAAGGGGGGRVVFLAKDGRLDVWDVATKSFWRTFTRCREAEEAGVVWLSVAAYKEQLYVLGLKSMRPVLKRLPLSVVREAP